MRVDVSEVKTYRECHRKHQFSSRNRFHLRPIAPNDNLIFGTQFHEVLAMMYMGTSLDKILEWINEEVKDVVYFKTMTCMANGYYNGPYQEDEDRFQVIDIEKSFNYPIGPKDPDALDADDHKYLQDENGNWVAVDANGEAREAISICGSIDMVVIDRETNMLCGFEHKTAKNFRPEVYNLVDEQPRVYSWALRKILKDYHEQGKYLNVKEVGPIFLNQVKKLSTKFSYERVACQYTEGDLNNFMLAFVNTVQRIAIHENNPLDMLPQPGYMKCSMCDFADLCMHYGYEDIKLDALAKEFDGEFEVRDHDHLDEKTQRHNEEVQP